MLTKVSSNDVNLCCIRSQSSDNYAPSFSYHLHICSGSILRGNRYSHVGMQLEVPGLVSQSKVVLGQFGLGRVEGHLVAGQPALVTQHCSCVDDRAFEVNVTAHVDEVTLIASLQLATLLAEGEQEDHTKHKCFYSQLFGMGAKPR